MITSDTSTLTPEQRASFDADWVRINSVLPYAGGHYPPLGYVASPIDDTARLGAIAFKDAGYSLDNLDMFQQYTVPGLLDKSDNYLSYQDQNNALALYAMGLQAEFNQSSANQAMQFNADQAALNRDWQTSANQKAMEFSADQAALNRDWQTSANQKAMDFSALQAQLNRDFQERMSNTAYQRAMQDLKDAGLNPILAYAQGGAATTSGATATGFSSSGSSASGFTSSGSSASGMSASSSFGNFDYATDREYDFELARLQKDIKVAQMDGLVKLGSTLSGGLLNIAASIARGGNTYNFN